MLEKIAKLYIDYPDVVNKAAAALLSFGILRKWMAEDSSPVLFLVLMILMFIFPFIYFVITIFSFIPTIVCLLYLQFTEQRNEKDFERKYEQKSENYYDYQQDAYERYEQENRQYHQYDYQNYQQQSNQQRQQHNQQRQQSQPQDDFHKAMSFYGLTMPFTEQQLRDKRRKLMKNVHPDSGGSENDAKKINMYFDILRTYTS